MDERYDYVIGRIKEVLSKTLPEGAEAYLYGSRARGDAHIGSDWDVMLIINIINKDERPDYDDFLKYSYPLTMLGVDIDETINPQMYSRGEWEKYSFTPFIKNVTQDGIRLWA